jgi:hypothetical protein
MGQAGKCGIPKRENSMQLVIIREPVITEDGREGFKKQTTYFIKKDKANGKKIKQVV